MTTADGRQVALVCGGVRGIGRAIGMELASRGWSVAACHRSAASQTMAEETAGALQQAGAARVMVQRVDASDPEAAGELVSMLEARWERIDALVNTLGPFRRIPLLQETAEGWRSVIDNNLHAVFYLCKAVSAGMKRRAEGRIINFGVVNSDRLFAQTHVTGYYIAKLGVLALTRSLARALAPHGVTVNAISPGFIDTGSAVDESLEPLLDKVPAGRIGEVRDVVAAAMYLLSDEASYVTGTNIHVSGGWGI